METQGSPPQKFGEEPRLPTKVFNDPVHGHLEFHPLCVKIIDTPQFQRLRFIKQLGGVYFVYPGAAHNRFEHCLGVCHLAGKLTQALKERQSDLRITEQDILCVQIAGLCHDLGHGPFSHVFDKDFIKLTRKDTKWKHEDASEHLFRYMVEANKLQDEFKKYGIVEADHEFILKLISGERPTEQVEGPLRGDKGFLYDIVANKRSGIDVDKWDYFKRDCHHLGISSGFDHTRFIQFAWVIKVDGEQQICFRDKEAYDVYEMFHTRFALHRKAYQHKIVQSVELMLVQAMIEAEKFITIRRDGDGKRFKISECIDRDKMDAYTNLTDEIFHQILQSDVPEAGEAKQLLKDMMKRKLYKCLHESIPTAHEQTISKTEEEIKEEILTAAKGSPDVLADLKTPRFRVKVANLDYGKKFKNPVDAVRFYRKDNPDEALAVSAMEVSHFIPHTTFKEQIIRVFFRPFDDEDRNSACRNFLDKSFRAWCSENNMKIPGELAAAQASTSADVGGAEGNA